MWRSSSTLFHCFWIFFISIKRCRPSYRFCFSLFIISFLNCISRLLLQYIFNWFALKSYLSYLWARWSIKRRFTSGRDGNCWLGVFSENIFQYIFFSFFSILRTSIIFLFVMFCPFKKLFLCGLDLFDDIMLDFRWNQKLLLKSAGQNLAD